MDASAAHMHYDDTTQCIQYDYANYHLYIERDHVAYILNEAGYPKGVRERGRETET